MDLLKVEHQQVQDKVNRYDEDRGRLKGWMITISAGLTALSLSAKQWPLLLLVLLATLLFALAELALIDIQEDVSARGAELEHLIDVLLHQGVSSEHSAYEFGIAKIFRGGGTLRWSKVKRWVLYRTFNPYMYVGLIVMPISIMAVGVASGTF